MANGDLTKRVDVRSTDEVGRMAGSLNKASESMNQTVRAIAGGVESLESSAQELSTVAGQVAASAVSGPRRSNVSASRTDARSLIPTPSETANRALRIPAPLSFGAGLTSKD